MSNLSSEVVFCRVAAAGDAGGCGGVRAFGAGGELRGKLGRVFAALDAAIANAPSHLPAIETKITDASSEARISTVN